MERRLKEIDTIVEEKPTEAQLKVVESSGPFGITLQHAETLYGSTPLSRPRRQRSKTLADFRRPLERPLPPTPLNFNQPNPTMQPHPPPPPQKPTDPTSQAPGISTSASLAPQPDLPQRSSTRARVSHWLFSWALEQPEPTSPEVQPSVEPVYQCSIPSTGSRTNTESAVSDTSTTSHDSSAPTFTTASSPEDCAITPPPYQVLPPYQEYDPNSEKPSGLVRIGVEVGIAV